MCLGKATKEVLRHFLGCHLDPSVNITGSIVVCTTLWLRLVWLIYPTPQQVDGVPNLNCDGTVNDNSGCGTLEWSRASYGEYFDSQGGGVFATKWDENEITACAYRPIEVTHDVRTSCWGIQGRSIAPQSLQIFSLTRRIHQNGVRRPRSWCRPTATR